MKFVANAKVNLALKILKKLDNGYHSLDMVMAPISLSDDIDISINASKEDKITILNNLDVDLNNNTVTKALAIMRQDFDINGYFDIVLRKNIPSQAGLGGGSSDAACVMLAINDLLQLNISKELLAKSATKIGADVPFFIYNKLARVQGIGEAIEILNLDYHPYLLIVKPDVGVSTEGCYQLYDVNPVEDDKKIDELIYAIKVKKDLSEYLTNSLLAPAIKIHPIINSIIDQLKALGLAQTMMSGSGSAIYAICDDYQTLKKVEKEFQLHNYFVGIYKII